MKVTVCYRIAVEGTITVEAEDLDDAKGRVEKTPHADLIKDGNVQFESVDVDDAWEG